MKAIVLSCAVLAASAPAQVFGEPFRLKAGAGFVDADVGHAAPYLHDLDGDGKRDLLVGQFGQGKLRIYRNRGTNEKPDYAEHTWLEAESQVVTTPAS
jgi:hypothetical protein